MNDVAVYEGAAMKSAVGGQGQHQDVGIGMTTSKHNEASPAPRETTSRPSAVDTGFTSIDNPTTKVDKSSAVAPNTTMSLSPWSLEDDPHAPKDPHTPHNSEVKVHDPANRGNLSSLNFFWEARQFFESACNRGRRSRGISSFRFVCKNESQRRT